MPDEAGPNSGASPNVNINSSNMSMDGGIIAGPQFGNTLNVPKLNKNDYQNWREMIGIILKLRGLGQALVTEVDEITDLQARLVLLGTMDESHRTQVRGLTTAKLIMRTIVHLTCLECCMCFFDTTRLPKTALVNTSARCLK